jgi:hypothetical protein
MMLVSGRKGQRSLPKIYHFWRLLRKPAAALRHAGAKSRIFEHIECASA